MAEDLLDQSGQSGRQRGVPVLRKSGESCFVVVTSIVGRRHPRSSHLEQVLNFFYPASSSRLYNQITTNAARNKVTAGA